MRMRFMLALHAGCRGRDRGRGFGAKTFFNGRSTDRAGLITKAMAASNTLSPHEIHLNYKSMKELPVHEVKEPF
jgi:hypothetical protein